MQNKSFIADQVATVASCPPFNIFGYQKILGKSSFVRFLGKFKGKIEIVSTRNPFCLKFAVFVGKVQLFVSSTFFSATSTSGVISVA